MMEENTRNIYLSVVIPAYNEEENIGILYASVKKVLETLCKKYEIVFVDDGSTDKTYDTLREIHQNDRALKVIKLRKNFGQTPALTAGIENAGGDIIITMDADLQNDPEDIPRLLEKMSEGYDIVSGWRKDRKDRAITRKIPSKIANWLIGAITGVRIHDYGCTLKAYRNSIIKGMHLYSDMHRFMPALGTLTGARTTEMEVKHHPRRFGKSKYGISRTGKVLLDLITVKLITRFSSRPLHLFGLVGITFLCASAFFCLKSVQLYLSYDTNRSFPLVIPSVFFLFSFLGFALLCFGVLSEMILNASDFRVFALKPVEGRIHGGSKHE